jgi:hypothetical protein
MNPSDLLLKAHVRRRQIELAESLKPKRAIYLDTKFWIILRDIVLGLRTRLADRELLEFTHARHTVDLSATAGHHRRISAEE